MNNVNPAFAAALKPFAPPQASAAPCSECGKPLPAVYFGSTNWMASGVCGSNCWALMRMEHGHE